MMNHSDATSHRRTNKFLWI